MKEVLINLLYIVSAILFIFGIKWLGNADTARRGNRISSVGMLLAVIATLLYGGLDWKLVAGGVLLGSVIGLVVAARVKMTGMPELVALFNGFGGLASLLVGAAEYHKFHHAGAQSYVSSLAAQTGVTVPLAFAVIAISLTILVGGITFTGSLVAWAKLSEKMSGRPMVFAGQKTLNIALLTASIAGATALGAQPAASWSAGLVIGLVAASLLIGILMTLPIGGGDMPVVISLLNAFSGVAAALAGFIILNNVLVVAGCLVGASGMILTFIMCKAMNRSIGNVLFGGFGAIAGKQKASTGEMRPASVEDAYYVLEAARSVVIIPGYGMAVAQAQHAVKELALMLENNGTEVRFAIHPVAGRMPGHMNVLLAEADVPYEQLQEMEPVNAIMPTVDVAIVIGANDVVNPAALDDPASPIFGMPIIHAHEAHTIYCLKRGKGTGFSGLENALFYHPNTRMLYGDAKATVSALAAEFGK
ncbi:MAG: NAD(P)(+) transhydrogenase (Re/Si-specific) subunit beta [Luteolibacter sp.]|nr:NAD(P)(+) transhydrogenase (Re/Si-specific) subunit beta [Luteolibacter sp.]